jgi:hypothetical protein
MGIDGVHMDQSMGAEVHSIDHWFMNIDSHNLIRGRIGVVLGCVCVALS